MTIPATILTAATLLIALCAGLLIANARSGSQTAINDDRDERTRHEL